MNPEELLTYPAAMRLITLKVASGSSTTELGIPHHYRVVKMQRHLGFGEEAFHRVFAAIKDFTIQRDSCMIISYRDRILRYSIGPTFSSSYIVDTFIDDAFTTETTVAGTEHKVRRAGMVLGTLPDHVECGEEAYLVELNRSGEVIGRCISVRRHRSAWARLLPLIPRLSQRWMYSKFLTAMEQAAT